MSAATVTLAPDTPALVSGAGAAAASRLRRDLGAEVIEVVDHAGVTPTAVEQAQARAGDPHYHRWLRHVRHAGGCSHPIRLVGTAAADIVDPATGEITRGRDTDALPDHVVYVACGNRRKVVCPSCAETYRADAYQLVLAGLKGGKGIPEAVSAHPAVFATLTGPSYGPVHTRRVSKTGQVLPCRPRRRPELCPHGRDIRCGRVHGEDETRLGHPFCLDCYDHDAHVAFNLHAGELFRRTRIGLDRIIARHAKAHGDAGRVRVSYGKAAEMQRRGLVHFHLLARFDGINPTNRDEIVPPPDWATVLVLAAALRQAVEHAVYTTDPHPDRPTGWTLTWGDQLDVRPVRVRGSDTIDDDRVLTEAAYGRRRTLSQHAVAGYLAKYATKSTEDTGHLSARLTADTITAYAGRHHHTGRLIAAAWRLGRITEHRRFRRWAHTLGYGGHFFTKSRRYTTTFGRLRQARIDWVRHRTHDADPDSQTADTVLSELTYQATGWNTLGDALLANSAAVKAREHRHTAHIELSAVM